MPRSRPSRLYLFLLAHCWVTLLVMGVSFVLFGLVSLNLLHLLSANFEFLRNYGLDAVREGALLQLAELAVSGYTAAFFYLLFKLCERVLVDRACTARAGTPATPPAAAPVVSAPPPAPAEAPATPAASPPGP